MKLILLLLLIILYMIFHCIIMFYLFIHYYIIIIIFISCSPLLSTTIPAWYFYPAAYFMFALPCHITRFRQMPRRISVDPQLVGIEVYLIIWYIYIYHDISYAIKVVQKSFYGSSSHSFFFAVWVKLGINRPLRRVFYSSLKMQFI